MVWSAVGCNLRRLIPAQVGRSFSLSMCGSVRFRHEVSAVLCIPTGWALCHRWNHGHRGPVFHVAERTWSRLLQQIDPICVVRVERAVDPVPMVVQSVFHALDEAGGPVLVSSVEVRLVLRLFGQTQEVASVATFVPHWPRSVTFEQQQQYRAVKY